MIRNFVTVLSAVVFTFLALSARAATDVVEAFGCNLNEGKTMADLDAANKYYVAERSKIASPPLQKMISRVWTPTIGNVPVDFVWFNSNLSYTEWGQMRDAFSASTVGAAIQARFDGVATCDSSSLHASEVLFSNLEAKPFKDDGGVVVESFRCRLHSGKSLADSDAALAAWKPVFTRAVASSGTSAIAMRRTPIVSGFDFDLSYLVAWDDSATYSATNEAYRSDPTSAKADALFNAAHRCESALFDARTMVAAPPAN